MTRNRLKELFREWFNNFLTIERFAEYYQMDTDTASRVVELGRKLHERECG